jgi:acetyl-CoA acetyltransferase
MRDVAVIGFAEAPSVRRTSGTTNGVEMLVPIFHEVLAQTGLPRAFSFVSAVDAIGAFPPVMESHVEMDGAWALYEAWVKVLTGEVDVALAYGFGKSSAGDLRRVLALQLDPYTAAPLWPDSVSIAALQARLGIDAGRWSEREMAEVAVRSRASAAANPKAQLSGQVSADDLLAQPYLADPLRAHDCAPITDGAAVVIIAAGDVAREHCERPAWITGFEHRIDSGSFGSRDLLTSPSAAAAASAASAAGAGDVEVAELHAPFTHQDILLRQAMGLGDKTRISPSGGTLAGNPMFAAGLARIGWAASQIISGDAASALGHATSGPALQQNLVCVMEARS